MLHQAPVETPRAVLIQVYLLRTLLFDLVRFINKMDIWLLVTMSVMRF